MQKKNYQVKSVFLNKIDFDFFGERSWLESEGKKKLKQKLSIDDIKYEEINENDTYFKLGVKFSGSMENGDGDEEIFSIYVIYSATFSISGFSDEEKEMLININCASFIYPYARSEMVKILSETNLPKIVLPPIDFVSFYHNKKQQQKNTA